MDRRTNLSTEDKEKRRESRNETLAVRAYLEMLRAEGLHRGKAKRTPQEELEEVESLLAGEEDELHGLFLAQRRLDAMAAIEEDSQKPDMETVESEFKMAVKAFSMRQGISYWAWRDRGVPAKVLEAGGVVRPRRRRK